MNMSGTKTPGRVGGGELQYKMDRVPAPRPF